MIDALTLLSNAQAVTTSAPSTNSYQLSALTTRLRDVGPGTPLRLRFLVGTTFSGADGLDLRIILASNTALTSNVLTLASSGIVPVADLTAGAFFDVIVPPVALTLGDGALRQYLGAYYAVQAAGTFSAGTVTTTITTGSSTPAGRRAFPAAYSTGPA